MRRLRTTREGRSAARWARGSSGRGVDWAGDSAAIFSADWPVRVRGGGDGAKRGTRPRAGKRRGGLGGGAARRGKWGGRMGRSGRRARGRRSGGVFRGELPPDEQCGEGGRAVQTSSRHDGKRPLVVNPAIASALWRGERWRK